MYHLCRENKGADQLCSYCAASLFSHMQKAGFSNLLSDFFVFAKCMKTAALVGANFPIKIFIVILYICHKYFDVLIKSFTIHVFN